MSAVSGPWSLWPVGARVVVRRRLAEGGWSDVLGELVASDEDGVVVRTRTGQDVRVPGSEIGVGKVEADPQWIKDLPPVSHDE